MSRVQHVTTAPFRSQGGRLVAPAGKELPLRAVELAAEAAGGIARTELRQVFSNPYDEPLKLTYQFPLPADGAVAGFEIRAGERVIRGEIDRREAARERYERAMVEGHMAALLDQERANLFTQNLGNVPPRTEVTVALKIDQPLQWLAEGMWEWRFPTVVAPRYLGQGGRVSDAEQVSVEVADRPTGVTVAFELGIGDVVTGGVPTSISHAVIAEGSRVRLADRAAALDRDIVVRWRVARPEVGVVLERARPAADATHADSAYGLLTIVPPEAPDSAIDRDLIILLDVSGSMSGHPIAQAKRVVARLIESLGENDRLEMIAFAHKPERGRRRPVQLTRRERTRAFEWLESLSAGGGTEMVSAIHDALAPLRSEAQRQVVIVTDGQIGFEGEAVRAIRDGLPAGSRLHAIGIGSASNRAFLHAAARAGRGVELAVDLDEDASACAARIVAATQGPTLVDLEISGSAVEATAPRKPADLMASAPVLQGVRLRPSGGELVVRGRTAEGAWERRIEVPATPCGTGQTAVVTLFGRESVEDLELDLACRGERSTIDREIERIGVAFGLATRRTSWIAVAEEPSVDPREPVRFERVPQELPYGMSVEGLGLAEAMRFPAAFAETFGGIARSRSLRVARVEEGYFPPAAFRGRVLPGPDGSSSIVEFVVDRPLDWRLPDEVTILTGKGRSQAQRARVLPSRSTRAGRIASGSIVRLELAVGVELLAGSTMILVPVGSEQVMIELAEES